MTIMLVPFMSCSAKLPVYGLITSAFFGAKAGIVVFALYVIGLCMGILSGILFKHTLFRGDPAPFVLELPPYRMPTLKNISLHVWERVRGFLVKAGTLILLMSVLLWLLQTFNFHFQMVDDSAESMLGVIGSVIAPIFRPLGFGTWQAAVSLLTGLVAKEAVVASMSLFYGFSTLDGASAIASSLTGFRPLTALSFLVFVLLYVPCVAAVSTIRKEMNSTKWTLASIGWQIICAYIVSLIVYQLGCLLGF
jgi:ferrous iron transport protein B